MITFFDLSVFIRHFNAAKWAVRNYHDTWVVTLATFAVKPNYRQTVLRLEFQLLRNPKPHTAIRQLVTSLAHSIVYFMNAVTLIHSV
jgi:hypothetical protein